MVYTLACRDFNLNCSAEVQDATIDGVLKKAQEHSGRDHPDAVAIMTLLGPEIPPALMKARIKQR